MKHSFWRVNLYVHWWSSGYRSRCKRCGQRWSFLADWKRLMLQKGFSHSFWCTRDTWSFLSLTVLAFEGKENALLFCHNRQLFSPSSYHICDQLLWTCPQKNICIANWLLLLKKRLKMKAERRRNHWRQKRVVFQKTFWTSRRKQEISKVLYSFFVWSMKSVERVFQTIIVQWKQSSSSQKKQ